jgi:hypothetical protein
MAHAAWWVPELCTAYISPTWVSSMCTLSWILMQQHRACTFAPETVWVVRPDEHKLLGLLLRPIECKQPMIGPYQGGCQQYICAHVPHMAPKVRAVAWCAFQYGDHGCLARSFKPGAGSSRKVHQKSCNIPRDNLLMHPAAQHV